ncbi:hypothetical protein BURPS1710A_A2941 [Burkholderia pseudomallei 1710a]|uniref:Uncharacterized protein n=1 Tax=Burkholderia pseudomallei 1710a TaxID=320371 RepID=A0A0E1VTX7_BURPE|nr:hypothetical protein BUC_4593 [Burkholderia pseudomallei 576]EET04323.1 hypothetical protein BURPS1710A_A2941 [Burkholderia pseudomallei 1710a]
MISTMHRINIAVFAYLERTSQSLPLIEHMSPAFRKIKIS